MGIVSSYFSKQKEQTIKTLEVLNQSIANLKLLQKEEQLNLETLQNNNSLIKQQIEESNQHYFHLQERHKLTIDTIKLFECKICMERLNKIMLVPCGHCFCLECSKTFNSCPICRSYIQSVNNIYFN